MGQDEISLNAEVGMYLDFKVTDTGIPYGCDGLTFYNNETWSQYTSGFCYACWTRLPKEGIENPDPMNHNDWYNGDVGCPLNKMQVPEGSTPLHEIFEEYAADQQKWVDDYVPTFEKMLSNGYNSEELTDAPDHFTGVVCSRYSPKVQAYKYYSCYYSDEISK